MHDPFRSGSPPPLLAAPPRCLYCASIVRDADACPRCDQPFVVTHEKRVGARCPRCGATLEQAAIDDATVYVCGECRGCFIHALDWDELIARSDEGARVSLGGIVPPPPGRGLTPSALFASATCPVCRDAMRRFEFAGHRGLWLDACPKHGLWLDSGELVATMHVHRDHPDDLEGRVEPRSIDESTWPPDAFNEYAPPPVHHHARSVLDLARAVLRRFR